jgi:hypothetical protein
VPVCGRLWAKLLHHGFTAKATVVRLPWEKLKKPLIPVRISGFSLFFYRFMVIQLFLIIKRCNWK